MKEMKFVLRCGTGGTERFKARERMLCEAFDRDARVLEYWVEGEGAKQGDVRHFRLEVVDEMEQRHLAAMVDDVRKLTQHLED